MNLLMQLNLEAIAKQATPRELRVGDMVTFTIRSYGKTITDVSKAQHTGTCVTIKHRGYSSSCTIRVQTGYGEIHQTFSVYSPVVQILAIVAQKRKARDGVEPS